MTAQKDVKPKKIRLILSRVPMEKMRRNPKRN